MDIKVQLQLQVFIDLNIYRPFFNTYFLLIIDLILIQLARSQRQIDINPAEFSKYKLEKPGIYKTHLLLLDAKSFI